MQEEQCKFLTHRLNAKAKESFGKRPFCRKDSRFAAAPMCRFAKCCGCLLRKSVILLWLRIPRYGIITSKLPLARLRVCKAHVTFRFCHETKQGKIRRAETRGISVFHMLGEYRQLIPGMLKNRGVLKAVAVSVILYVTNMVSTNFFGLYVTQRLGLSENFLALFPILNAAVMLIFMIGLQHRINATKFRIPLWIGLALYVVAALVLIFSPADRLGFVLLYVFIAAVAAALVNPRKDALLQLNITPQERARLNALIMASTVALSSPFGYLAGWLSSMDRRLPFVFTLLLFVTAMFVIGRIQEPQVEER